MFSRFQSAWYHKTNETATLVIAMDFERDFHELYGTPERVFTVLETMEESTEISLTTIVGAEGR